MKWLRKRVSALYLKSDAVLNGYNQYSMERRYVLNQEFISHLKLGPIRQVQSVSGGDINQAYQLETTQGRVFLLIQPNHTKAFFTHEINGLKLLEQFVKVPKVLSVGHWQNDAYLVLSYLAHQSHGDDFALGQALAHIHQKASPNHHYGFGEAFTMGTFTADNTWQSSWSQFFIQQRLEPLKELCHQQGVWSLPLERAYQKAIIRFKMLMGDYQPQPVLLHGDLWSGNFMFDLDGRPIMIDPAVFYGDREFDLGITQVFGGFNAEFYRGYQETYPVVAGFEQRVLFYELYYLMFHLSQFGIGYQQAVTNTLSKINR